MWRFRVLVSFLFLIEINFHKCALEIKRHYKGDLFVLNKSENCSEIQCGEGGRRAVNVPWKDCQCQCLTSSPSYRQDTGMCVDDISECRLIPFQSPVASENIPLVFLPPIGNTVHCSAEIVLDKVTQTSHLTCHVFKERFLTDKGWLSLKNLTRTGLAFQLIQDSQKIFLQFVGPESTQEQLEGQLILIDLACQAENNANIIPHPCVAFRVAGLLPSSSSLPNTKKWRDWMIVGLGAVFLGFTYVLAILIYLVVRKRHEQKRREPNEAASVQNEHSGSDNIGGIIYDPSATHMSDVNHEQCKNHKCKAKQTDIVGQDTANSVSRDFLTRLFNVWTISKHRFGGEGRERPTSTPSNIWNRSLVDIPEESASVCDSTELDGQCRTCREAPISNTKIGSNGVAFDVAVPKECSTSVASKQLKAISGNWSARCPSPNPFGSDRSRSKGKCHHHDGAKSRRSSCHITKSSSLNVANPPFSNRSSIVRQSSCRTDSSNFNLITLQYAKNKSSSKQTTEQLKSTSMTYPITEPRNGNRQSRRPSKDKCDCGATRRRTPPVSKEEHYYSMTDNLGTTVMMQADHVKNCDGQQNKRRDLPPIPTSSSSSAADSAQRKESSVGDDHREDVGTALKIEEVSKSDKISLKKQRVTQVCRRKCVEKCRSFEKVRRPVEIIEPLEEVASGNNVNGIAQGESLTAGNKWQQLEPTTTTVMRRTDSTASETKRKSVSFDPNDTVIVDLLASTVTDTECHESVGGHRLVSFLTLRQQMDNVDQCAGNDGVGQALPTKVARSESSALDYGTLMIEEKKSSYDGKAGAPPNGIRRSESIQRDFKMRTVYERLQNKQNTNENIFEENKKSRQEQGACMVLSLIDSFNRKGRRFKSSMEIPVHNQSDDRGHHVITGKRLLGIQAVYCDDSGYQSGDSEWSAGGLNYVSNRVKQLTASFENQQEPLEQ